MKFFVQVMLLCLSTVLVAQTQISGTVTDKDGQPVPGANVVVDNLTGAVTDFDGNFSLSTTKTLPFTINVSSVGLKSQTVTVSSLYGADAYKGIVFMNSISPFDKQGISVSYKTGITEQDSAGTNDFIDIGVRMAAKLSDKLAIKATIAHKEGTDWSPEDYSHYQGDNN